MFVDITGPARADLKSIAAFSKRQWGAEQGHRYIAEINDKFRRLARQPQTGGQRPDIPGDYRALLAGSHIIFYRIAKDVVVIVRVLHQSMDAPAHISKG
jgi:toxin ParE1/3/4